jgi:hypothetical protein
MDESVEAEAGIAGDCTIQCPRLNAQSPDAQTKNHEDSTFAFFVVKN